MSNKQLIAHAFAISAIAFTFSVSAQAAASRTFVATTGSDANTAVNCSATANCRTFGAALSVTSAGGEVVVLNSGGYGPALIGQPVIITATGIDASISVTTSGGNGLTISTSGNVTLTGLNLHGEATGANGVMVEQVGFLRLFNVLIENFTNDGIQFNVAGKLAIYGSAINDNTADGLQIQNGSALAYVHNTSFDNNGNGVEVASGFATVTDSDAHNNKTNAFLADGGNLTLYNDRAIFNVTGFATSSGGKLYFANCLLSNNTTAYNVGASTTMSGSNPGTTLIAPGQTETGTLSAAVALQ